MRIVLDLSSASETPKGSAGAGVVALWMGDRWYPDETYPHEPKPMLQHNGEHLRF